MNNKPSLISEDMIDNIISEKNVLVYETPSNTVNSSNFQSFNNLLFICCFIILILFFINKSLNYYNKHHIQNIQKKHHQKINNPNKQIVYANDTSDTFRPIEQSYTEAFSQNTKKQIPKKLKTCKMNNQNNQAMQHESMQNQLMQNKQISNKPMNNQNYIDDIRTEQQIPSNVNYSKTVNVNEEKNVYEQFNNVQSKEDQKQLTYEEIQNLRNQQNEEIGNSFNNNNQTDLRDNTQYNVKKDNSMQNIQQEINAQQEIYSSNEVDSAPLGGDSLSFSYL